MQEITREEFEKQDDQKEILITTQKYKYSFGASDYVVVNDSIVGYGRLDKREGDVFNRKLVVDFDGSIALSDVQKLKLEKFDIIRTVIAIRIPIVIVVILGNKHTGSDSLLRDWNFEL